MSNLPNEETSCPDPATVEAPKPMGILQRRKIEAAIIAPIYDELRQRLGEAEAQAIIDAAVSKAAMRSAREFADATEEGTSLLTFQALQSLWTQDDALEIEVVRADDKVFDYNVLRCRYAETYREMGLGHIGHLLSCNRDAVFCKGYDARIKMSRTQTIMQGATHCDFRYVLEEKTAP